LNQVVDRVRRVGLPLTEQTEGLLLRDPSQNGLILTVA